MTYQNSLVYRAVVLLFLLLMTTPAFSAEEVDFLDLALREIAEGKLELVIDE